MQEDEKKPAWKSIIDNFKEQNKNFVSSTVNSEKSLNNGNNTREKHTSTIITKTLSKSNSTDNKSSTSQSNDKNKKPKISVAIKNDGLIHIRPNSAQLYSILNKYSSKKLNYNTEKKTWTCTIDFYKKINTELKKNFNFLNIPEGVIKRIIKESAKDTDISDFKIEDNEDNIYLTLLPFQIEGLKHAIHKNGRILLADEMGLGKTYQSLAIAYFYRLEWPLLILCPASLLNQWQESVRTFLKQDAAVVRKMEDLGDKINIISYDIAAKNYQLIHNHNFKVIIVDECHYLKNPNAKRTSNLLNILQNCTRLVLLSGTPCLSRPIELYNVIMALDKSIFRSMSEYGYRYCNLRRVRNFFDWKGSSNCDELDFFLRKCFMIRRLKDDVLGELPEKFRRHVVLDIKKYLNKAKAKKNEIDNAMTLSDEDVYFDMLEFSSDVDYTKEVKYKDNGLDVEPTIMQKYQEAAELKIEPVKEYIRTLLNRNMKFVIFAHHKIMMDGLEIFLKENSKYVRIDGSTPSVNRQKLVKMYQEDDSIKVALLSLTACSTGLTLTAGKAVIFSELYWNPGVLLQAEDRIHRIGQKDTVNIHYLVGLGTIDEIVWPIILKKLNVLESLGVGSNELKSIEKVSSKQKDIHEFTENKK